VGKKPLNRRRPGVYYINMTKIITIIVVALLIVAGGWWYVDELNQTNSVPSTFVASTSSSQGNASDASDASIDQSMASVDGQMNGLNSDSASVDEGLNDKSIQQ